MRAAPANFAKIATSDTRGISAKFAAAAAAVIASCALGGCNGGVPGAPVPGYGPGMTWRWRATSMKLSALTTPLPAEGHKDASIDVRVAFFDSEEDETKAIGLLTVLVSNAGRELARTEISLSDERRHREHWDPVTETYSVHLLLAGGSAPQPEQTLEIHATFEGDDGSLMKSSRDVKWPRVNRVVPPNAEPAR